MPPWNFQSEAITDYDASQAKTDEEREAIYEEEFNSGTMFSD